MDGSTPPRWFEDHRFRFGNGHGLGPGFERFNRRPIDPDQPKRWVMHAAHDSDAPASASEGPHLRRLGA